MSKLNEDVMDSFLGRELGFNKGKFNTVLCCPSFFSKLHQLMGWLYYSNEG